MKFDKATAIHFGVTFAVVIAAVVVANTWVQPMVNSSRVSAPATA